VIGTGVHEPAGCLPAQATCATRDQYGAPGLPGAGAGSGWHKPPAERSRGADRDLVLATGQDGGQPGSGPVVHGLRQVDQAAPAIGVLQRGHPAHAPDTGLNRARHGVPAADRDRTPRHAPQWSVHTRIAQRLHQCRGQHRPTGLGEREQRHDPGVLALGKLPGQRLPIRRTHDGDLSG
jgi:hypothetical protein